MKILMPKYFWIGGFSDNIEEAFKKQGHEVVSINYSNREVPLFKNPLNQFKSIAEYNIQKKISKYNAKVRSIANSYKPDMVFVRNSGKLEPYTIKYLRENLGCYCMCLLSDNPFDSSRSKFTAMNFPYYHTILSTEKTWIPNITNVAPQADIYEVKGGYNPQHFYPIDTSNISKSEEELYQCEVSFTGAGYGQLAEGSYRALILYHISNYNLKIWSNDDWSFRFKYYPELRKNFMGKRLPLENLRKLYTLSSINLNMPSPQIFTSFQPRLFEIAACKGFQIIDYREDLDKYFSKDELVTFRSINELREKIDYFTKNPKEKESYIEKLYNTVTRKHNWEKRVQEYLELTKLHS